VRVCVYACVLVCVRDKKRLVFIKVCMSMLAFGGGKSS
jgi:hypothetical protein